LRSITKKYPTRSDLQVHLEDMYSAGFSAGIGKIGLSHLISFDLSIIDNKYTFNNEDLFTEGINFLREVILNPKFSNEIFVEEKRLLSEYFQGIYANKMRYSLKQTFATMYEDEAFNVDAFGREEDLKDLTLEDCVQAYNDMLNNDVININIVGDVDVLDVSTILNKMFNFNPRDKELILIDKTPKPVRETQELFESQNVNQAKMVIGHQFPVFYSTDDYYKAIVLNTLIGSGPESLLFKRIREELSLVYFVGSVYDQNKGSFIVYGGINQNDYKEVLKEVENILQDVKAMTYDDKYLVIAKKGIVSGLVQSLDSSGSLISRLNSLSLYNKEFDLEILIDKINKVTKMELSSLIDLIKKDVTFLLRNDQLENN
jgi:predicted Zn-dependent peptidase